MRPRGLFGKQGRQRHRLIFREMNVCSRSVIERLAIGSTANCRFAVALIARPLVFKGPSNQAFRELTALPRIKTSFHSAGANERRLSSE